MSATTTNPAAAVSTSTEAPSSSSSSLYKEELLDVASGRTLAFDHCGTADSSLVIVFYHGVFGVGNARDRSEVISKKRAHFIAPTLPGWGRTTKPSSGETYADTIASDFAAIISHLYPDASTHSKLDIIVAGGSFGTIPAQMIYCQPAHRFPLATQIRSLLLLSPLSSPAFDPAYNKHLAISGWLMVGAPAHYIPFLPRMFTAVFKPKFATIDTAEKMIRETLFDKMDEAERRDFEEYRIKHNMKVGQLEREFAQNAFRSVQYTMDGFLGLNAAMYEKWPVLPKAIDANAMGRRVLIYGAKEDKLAPFQHAQCLAENYSNSKLVELEGGHIAGLTKLEAIWGELLKDY